MKGTFLALILLLSLILVGCAKQDYEFSPIIGNKETQKIYYSDGAPMLMSAGKQTGIVAGTKIYDGDLYINLVIYNASSNWVELDPSAFKILAKDESGQSYSLPIYSQDEYLARVKGSQGLSMFFSGLGNAFSSMRSGYSTTHYSNGSYSDTYDYGKQQAYVEQKNKEQAAQQAEYSAQNKLIEDAFLKRNTIFPNQRINGWLVLKYIERTAADVSSDIYAIENEKNIVAYRIKSQLIKESTQNYVVVMRNEMRDEVLTGNAIQEAARRCEMEYVRLNKKLQNIKPEFYPSKIEVVLPLSNDVQKLLFKIKKIQPATSTNST